MTRIANTCLVIATVAVLMFEVNVLTSAQEAAPQPEDADRANRCIEHMDKFMQTKRVELGEFINTHFRSAKPTSQLISAAIEKFAQYRKEVRTEMQSRGFAKVTIEAAKDERPACEAFIQEKIDIERDRIAGHITQNAYSKKSTRLIDKYKEINGKLEKLNFTVAQTYGYFGALSQKLPCYATQCVK